MFELKRLHVLKKLQKSFGISGKRSTFASAIGKTTLVTPKANANAEIAQLVEHNLAKVGVASSSLVFRSHIEQL